MCSSDLPMAVGGAITVVAPTINLAASTGLTAGGDITLTAAGGHFTQAATAPIVSTSTTTTAIRVTVNSAGNAVLGRLTADAGTLTITANGGGAMSDNNDGSTVVVNLSAKNITLVSTGTIGAGNAIEYMSPNTPVAPAKIGRAHV